MQQDELFYNTEDNLLLQKGQLSLYRNFLDFDLSLKLKNEIEATSNWEQSEILILGQKQLIPRLNAWYADDEKNYAYSGTPLPLNSWTPPISSLKKAIEEKLSLSFNSCLLNLYRDGNDSVAWHADDEPELGIEPTIASISLGQERKFIIRNKLNHNDKLTISLPHNSMLVMRGNLQSLYEHKVPKTSLKVNSRLNLTFRKVCTPPRNKPKNIE